MATLGKSNNTNFLPRGNTPKPGLITPKSKAIAEKTDVSTNANADPIHDWLFNISQDSFGCPVF